MVKGGERYSIEIQQEPLKQGHSMVSVSMAVGERDPMGRVRDPMGGWRWGPGGAASIGRGGGHTQREGLGRICGLVDATEISGLPI